MAAVPCDSHSHAKTPEARQGKCPLSLKYKSYSFFTARTLRCSGVIINDINKIDCTSRVRRIERYFMLYVQAFVVH